MFLTDARELGAREVAPDALLVKLPKKKRKIKKSNKSEENPENRKKVLVDPVLGPVCRICHSIELPF